MPPEKTKRKTKEKKILNSKSYRLTSSKARFLTGFVSYRNIEDGSWFIENFVAVMNKYITGMK